MEKLKTLLRRFSKTARQQKLDINVTPIPNQETLGTPYGGWTVPVGLLTDQSICYCFGAGEDISFDVTLVERLGCHVYTFDPTPRSIAYVKRLQQSTSSSDLLEKLHFYEFGIWNENATLKFYAPQEPGHVSHSIVNLQHTTDYFEAQCYTLEHIMNMFGHQYLDLLKLDIEGAEYVVLESMIQHGIKPRILCVEFDEGHHPQDDGYVRRIQNAITRLTDYGYRVTLKEEWNLTFVDSAYMPPSN